MPCQWGLQKWQPYCGLALRINAIIMFLNYLKVAWRNLRKNKVFSLVNILGLALSMISSMLIMLWIIDEQSYDSFLPGSDRAYRLVQHQNLPNGVVFKSTATPAPMPGYIKEHYPGISEFTRVRPDSQKRLFSYKETRLYDYPTYVDSTFFTVFPFKMLEGDAATALMEPNSVVLTKSAAEKYFGNEDAMGKTLMYNNAESYKVTGILDDLPSNTHFKFSILLPFRKLYEKNWGLDWNNNFYYGYFKLAPQADPAALSASITEYAKSNEELVSGIFYLQAVKDIRLYSDFDIDLYGISKERHQYVRIFWIVAILIIFIACINFMNLSTARSEKRAKEVGLRKTIGARRSAIIGQLLSESLIFALLAYVLALGAIFLLLPAFNNMVDKQLVLGLQQWPLLLAFFGGAILIGLLAGSYPALVLSSFQPIKVLKGTFNPGKGGVYFRRTLVVVQFAVTVVLILGTLVVYQQFQYFMNKNLGYNKDQLIYLPRQGAIGKNYNAFRQELLRHPSISSITTSSDIPTYTVHLWGGFHWDGKDENDRTQMNCYSVGFDFVETMGFTIKEGRSFSVQHPTDSFNYILNEAAVRHIGMKDPIGKRFGLGDNNGTIIGVVKDFNFKSLHQKVEPLVMRINPWWDNYYFIRMKGDNTAASLKLVEAAWNKFNPGYPFAYNFVNDDYSKLYESEKRMGSIFNYFSGFALFIACLGLFGLISFLAEKKSKEIGIRKVHGASVSNILVLLSGEYIRLLLVAFCISLPLGSYLLRQWLNNYAYHVDMPWWLYVVPGLIVFLVALLTVSGQVLKAAQQNPVHSLKAE
jgi:ABC-type antimicrobial peptide transport system permease subunit